MKNIRVIGTMQIANEHIVVIEKLDQEHEAEIVWTAYAEDDPENPKYTKDVGAGIIIRVATQEGMVWVTVKPEYCRNGIGRFMGQIATDMGIRYRFLKLTCAVTPNNAAGLKLLEEEEFEKDPQQSILDGFVKQLRR